MKSKQPKTATPDAVIENDAGFNDDQRAQFQRDGFVIAERLIDSGRVAEIRDWAIEHERLRSEPIEYEADVQYPGAPPSREAPGGATPRRLLQAYRRSEPLAGLAHDPLLALRLGQLLGEDRIWLTQSHHNCLMTKCPSYSSDTGWHQDVRYWSFSNNRLINAWLALGQEYPENGGLRLIPGSHRWTGLSHSDRLDADLFLRPEHPANATAIRNAVNIQLEPGDVLFFHAAAFHSASRNRTDATKHSVVFSYHGPANRPEPDSKSTRYPEIEIRVPGIELRHLSVEDGD